MLVPKIRSAFPVFSYRLAQPSPVKTAAAIWAATGGPVFSLAPTLEGSSDAR